MKNGLGNQVPLDPDYLIKIVPLIQERVKTLKEVWERTGYFYQEEVDYEEGVTLIQKGMDNVSARIALDKAAEALGSVTSFEHQSLEELLRTTGEVLGLSPRQFFGILRVAVTGRKATPPLFETMEVLGRDLVLRRVGKASQRVNAAGESLV